MDISTELKAILLASVSTLIKTQFGAFSSGVEGLPFVDELVKAVDSIQKIEMEQLQKEFEALESEKLAFESDYFQRQQELNQLEYDLGINEEVSDSLLDTLNMGVFYNADESPSQFLARTLQTNPGLESIEAVHVYAANSLLLPEVNETTLLG